MPPRRTVPFLGLSLLAMTLGLGCDFVGGVTRYAELEVPLTPECVRRGLEQAGGVSDIRYHAPDYSSTYHRFDYRVAGLDNSLLFEHRFGYGATRYWHEYSRLNAAPPQAEVDRIRPQLARIDASIGRECGVPELPSQMAEDCRGVECKAPD